MRPVPTTVFSGLKVTRRSVSAGASWISTVPVAAATSSGAPGTGAVDLELAPPIACSATAAALTRFGAGPSA